MNTLAPMTIQLDILGHDPKARRRQEELLRLRAELVAARRRRRREVLRAVAGKLSRSRAADRAPHGGVSTPREAL
jgi:hypothetical protein